MFKVIGVDEAGRGPVIGSMFVGFAIIVIDGGEKEFEEFQKMLVKKGVKDSKLLSSKRREMLFEELAKILDIKFVQITPLMIDKQIFSGKKINSLEIEAILNVLESERPNLVFLDGLTSKPEKFGRVISEGLSFDCKVISENKADFKYAIVGAASIIAKQMRENELKVIRKEFEIDFGSGYPSDPNTKRFLMKEFQNEKFGFIFRKSWKTYQNLSAKVHKD